MNSQTKMMKALVSSGISGTISQVLVAASNLISLPILVASLGKVEYGIWVLVGNALIFLAMSDFGVVNSVGRLVAKYKCDNNQDNLTSVVNTVLALLLTAGLIIAIATISLSFFVVQILNIDPNDQHVTQQMFMIGGGLLAITLPLRAGNGFLSGFQKYTLINYSQAALSVINLSGVCLLSALGQLRLIELIILYSATSLLIEAFRFYHSLTFLNTAFSPKYISKAFVREIIDLASSSITTTLTTFGYRQGIVIAIAHLLSVAEAGIFGICLVIMNSISRLLSQISIPIVTLVSEHSKNSSLSTIRTMNNVFISISFGLALCVLFGIIAYADTILNLLFHTSDWKKGDYTASYISLIIMSACLAIGMPQMGSRSVLLGGGQHWYVARSTLFGSTASIVVAIIVMKYFGLYGAAIGWSTTWILQGLFLYPPAIKKRLEQSYVDMGKDGYLPGAYCGIIVGMYLWFISYWITPTDLAQLISSILFSAILALGFLYIRLKPSL